MISKKEYVLKLLIAIQDDRGPAEGLRIIIEKGLFDDQVIDALYMIFDTGIKVVNSQRAQKALEKAKDFLNILKQKELNQTNKDQEDIQKMEEILNNM